MKRWRKVLLLILLVVIGAVAALCVWQQDNIKALYTAFTKDETAILQDMEQNKKDLEGALVDHNITVLAPTVEQSQALIDGTARADEVKAEMGLTGGTTAEAEGTEEASSAPQSSQGASSPSGGVSSQAQAEQLINNCVSELYACEVDLMARLGAMKQEAVNLWNSLSPEERTSSKKREIGMDGLDQCYVLEVEIDQTVESILSRYRTELEKLGADTSVLDTLWDYYCNEKNSQKAYYLNKYLN